MWRSLLLPLLCSIFSPTAFAMPFSNPLKTCVFSEVKAHLTQDGKPLSGATVIRRWEWQKLREQRTTTDENGYFQFPATYEYSIARLFPMEVVIGQGLYVVMDGGERAFWTNGKRSPEENSEYSGQGIALVCELADEEVLNKEHGSLMVTLCKLAK